METNNGKLLNFLGHLKYLNILPGRIYVSIKKMMRSQST